MKRVVLSLLILSIGLVLVNCESPALKGAKIYMKDKKLDLAKEQLEKALEANPIDAEAHYMLGDIYYQEANYDKGNDHFLQSMGIAPTFVADIDNIKSRAFQTHFGKGARAINKAIEVDNLDETRDALNQAIADINVALTIMIQPSAYKALGAAYLTLGVYDKAKENLQLLIDQDPKEKDALFQMGIIYYNDALENSNDKEKFTKAIEYFEDYVTYYPEEKSTLLELGVSYEFSEQIDKAIDYYKEMLVEHPDNSNVLIRLGSVQFNNDFKAEARVAFDKALALDPTNKDAMYNIAFPMFTDIYNKMQDKEDTIEEWETALIYMERYAAIDATNAEAWDYLAIIYAKLDMGDKMREAMAKSEELKKIK